jgi:hypothetical protein
VGYLRHGGAGTEMLEANLSANFHEVLPGISALNAAARDGAP